MLKKKRVARKPVRSRKGRWDTKGALDSYLKRCKTCGKPFHDYSIVTGKRELVNCGKCRENACLNKKRTGHNNPYR